MPTWNIIVEKTTKCVADFTVESETLEGALKKAQEDIDDLPYVCSSENISMVGNYVKKD